MSSISLMRLLVAVNLLLLVRAQPATLQDLNEPAARERELTNLLQARLRSSQGERSADTPPLSLLGKGSSRQQESEIVTSTTLQTLNVPATVDVITPKYWNSAEKILKSSGMSTPIPSAAYVNAPPPPPKPTKWQDILQEAQQPLSTKLGSAIMIGVTPAVTPTPPPMEAAVAQQFVAQCPMVLFEKDLSIRAPSCNDTLGRWIDPSPLNSRVVLRWKNLPPAGLFLGVDSALSGPGSAYFAAITQVMTLTGYKFVMKNCLGIERWHIEENVYKVDSMGKVSSTMELHAVTMNSAAYFIKYLVKSPEGVVVAESNLFRTLTNQFNFTTVEDGQSTGHVIAVVTKQGIWFDKGWEQCMAPTSPRGWSIFFPEPVGAALTTATVQDIRVAIAGSVNLMAYRNEERAADGINSQGAISELYTFIGGVALACIGFIMLANFFMVWRNSGLKDKIKKVLFDTQGLMPKRPYQQREAPLHPSY